MNNIKNYGPFQLWVLNNFPFTIDDWDSITQYQMLCKCLGALKEQLDFNSDLYKKITDLENYVSNYFENLDVQDEIDNKLDEMVESGELQEIITEYLQINGVLAFDTVSDLKSTTNVINGSIVKTLGYYSVDDEGGSYYKVRTVTNEDTVDEMTIIALNNETLIAELVIDNPLNIAQLGAKLNGTDDDSSYLNKACSIANNIIYPKGKTTLLNNVEIPSDHTIDFNNATIITDSIAIKESDLTETTGYNYRKNIYIKNITFDLEENQKGIYLCNTIKTTIENIKVNKNVPSGAYIIYYTNCFNLTFRDIYITGTTNDYNENSYGIYGDIQSGGIAGTNAITNMLFENILIQRLANAITFDKNTTGSYDTIKLINIGSSWVDKALNITDNLDHTNTQIEVNTLRAEHTNYAIYNNGNLVLTNIKAYNCVNGIYNKGRSIAYGKIEITGTSTTYAIYNSGNLDLSNCILYSSSSFNYSLGTNIKNCKQFAGVTKNQQSFGWINDYPEPQEYTCNFTGSNIYLDSLVTPNRNNVHIIVNVVNGCSLYVATGTYYDIKTYDYLELIYSNSKWSINTSAKLITP